MKKPLAANVNTQHEVRLSPSEKLALRMAKLAGSMVFFWCCVALTLVPYLWPVTMQTVQFVSSGFLQLVLLPVILIAGNLSSQHAELRAEAHYQAEVEADSRHERLVQHTIRIHRAVRHLQRHAPVSYHRHTKVSPKSR